MALKTPENEGPCAQSPKLDLLRISGAALHPRGSSIPQTRPRSSLPGKQKPTALPLVKLGCQLFHSYEVGHQGHQNESNLFFSWAVAPVKKKTHSSSDPRPETLFLQSF